MEATLVAPPVAVRFKDEAPPPQAEPAGDEAPPSPSDDGAASSDEERAVPPRALSAAEASAQADALDADPRFVLALDFVAAATRARALPDAPPRWTVDSVAADLVACDGGPGTVLAGLHAALIRGASPRAPVDGVSWPANVAERLKRAAAADDSDVADGVPADLMIAKRARAAYATATAVERAAFLLALCEVVAGRLWPALETAARGEAAAKPKPGKKSRPRSSDSDSDGSGSSDNEGDQEQPLPVPPLTALLRRKPLGVDAAGATYHFFDWGAHGVRLCRARPPPVKDVAAAAAGKRDAGALPPAAWDTLAKDGDAIRVVAAKLARSRLPLDRALAATLTRAAASADRAADAARVADRLARAGLAVTPSKIAAAVAAGPGLAAERGRRTAAKRVDYTFTGFDAAVRAATRRGGADSDSDTRGRRRRGPSPTRFESGAAAARAGLRRGRSAYDTAGPAAPDVGRLERAARAAAKKARRERREAYAKQVAEEEEEDDDMETAFPDDADDGANGGGYTLHEVDGAAVGGVVVEQG